MEDTVSEITRPDPLLEWVSLGAEPGVAPARSSASARC